MARIRSIKPDFFQSEDVSALPLRARLTWIGLWLHCDDHGRTKDVPRLIKGWIWSMDDVSLRDVEDDLAILGESGRIVRYRVNDRAYIAVTNWHQHQSPPKMSGPKYPSPPVPVGVPEPDENGHCQECWENDQKCRSQGVSSNSRSPTVAVPEDYSQERKGTGNREGKGSVGDEIADADPLRPEVESLCSHLADRIEANGTPRPTVGKKWRDAARLMLDRDGRSEQQVHAAIDWCQDHEFWRSNILSMPKLREKYDQLRLQATQRNGSNSRRQAETDEMFDRAMARARARDEGLPP